MIAAIIAEESRNAWINAVYDWDDSEDENDVPDPRYFLGAPRMKYLNFKSDDAVLIKRMRKREKNKVSRAVFSRLRDIYLGDAEVEESDSIPEEINEYQLNRSYDTVRFSTVIDVQFFSRHLPSDFQLPPDYSYKASLRTDQLDSVIFFEESVSDTDVLEQPQTISKKVFLETCSRESLRKRVCTPSDKGRRLLVKSILKSRMNRNFMHESYLNLLLESVSYEDFEENFERRSNMKWNLQARRKYKYLQVALHYRIIMASLRR